MDRQHWGGRFLEAIVKDKSRLFFSTIGSRKKIGFLGAIINRLTSERYNEGYGDGYSVCFDELTAKYDDAKNKILISRTAYAAFSHLDEKTQYEAVRRTNRFMEDWLLGNVRPSDHHGLLLTEEIIKRRRFETF